MNIDDAPADVIINPSKVETINKQAKTTFERPKSNLNNVKI